VVGTTFSFDLPTTAGALQPSFGGYDDAYLAKVDPAAAGPASLVYSTYLVAPTMTRDTAWPWTPSTRLRDGLHTFRGDPDRRRSIPARARGRLGRVSS